MLKINLTELRKNLPSKFLSSLSKNYTDLLPRLRDFFKPILDELQNIKEQIKALEKVKDFYAICGTIGCILSVFPILGGIVTLKRKMRGLALVGSLIGLFMIGPLFASSIISLIGMILVGLAKEEFQ